MAQLLFILQVKFIELKCHLTIKNLKLNKFITNKIKCQEC